jgi:predicted deacylase
MVRLRTRSREVSRLIVALMAGGLIAISLRVRVAGEDIPARIALGTAFETPVWVLTGTEAGPTILIVGGIHGNEAAGALAAEQLRRLEPRRGRLIIVPRANVVALEARTRRVPGVGPEEADLNRCFPRRRSARPIGELARAIWTLAELSRPDWVLDLHEGVGVAGQGSSSVGSSVISDPRLDVIEIAERMVAAVNSEIADPARHFVIERPPVIGSLARAASDLLGARSMILETTSTRQALSLRARQHRVLVRRFLIELGIVDASSADSIAPPRDESTAPMVGIYDDRGASIESVASIELALRSGGIVIPTRVGTPDVLAGALRDIDVLIVPSGKGADLEAGFGGEGREAVAAWVRSGGVLFGVSGGALLTAHGRDWSWGLAETRIITHSHDADATTSSADAAESATSEASETSSTHHSIVSTEQGEEAATPLGRVLPAEWQAPLTTNFSLAIRKGSAAVVEIWAVFSAATGTDARAPAILVTSIGPGLVVQILPRIEKSADGARILGGLVRAVGARRRERRSSRRNCSKRA